MKERILYQLKEIRPEVDFTKSENFILEGFLDSFDLVSLVTSLDEEFNISIIGTDIIPENFSSIDKIYELLIKYQSKP